MIVLIPARSGSEGIKDKNILPLLGYPIMTWSIAIGKQLGLATWVMTDSRIYKEIAKSFDALVVDEAPGLPGTGDFRYLKYMFNNIEDDEIVLLRPTTPLREINVVKKAINQFKSFGIHTSMRSACEMAESAYKCVLLSDGYFKPIIEAPIKELFNLPRQYVPKTYHPNGYVDIIMRRTIESGTVYGDRIQPFITSDVWEIDCPEDFQYISWMASEGVGQSTYEYLRNHFNTQPV